MGLKQIEAGDRRTIAAEIDFYSLVVFAHVVSAVAGLGATFVYPFFWAAARQRFPRSLPSLLATQASIGPRLIGPSRSSSWRCSS